MKIFSTFTLILLMGCYQPVLDPDPLEEAHIIDWHVHVAGLGFGGSGNFINKEMQDNFRFEFFLSWMDETEEELKEYGDQILIKKLNDKIVQSKYVDQAVVLAMDGVIDEKTKTLDRKKTQVYVSNEFVASQTAKYPDLLFLSTRPLSQVSIHAQDHHLLLVIYFYQNNF